MPVKSTEKLENEIQQSTTEFPEQPIREITLTDKLNKRLLQSFLNRINNFEHDFNKMNGDTSNPNLNEENEFK